jgi:hypothetical protein
MCSVLFRAAARCDVGGFWTQLVAAVIPVISFVCTKVPIAHSPHFFAFCSILGLFGIESTVKSEDGHNSVTSSRTFEAGPPFVGETVSFSISSEVAVPIISFIIFMYERCLLFEPNLTRDANACLTRTLAAFTECIIIAIGRLPDRDEVQRFLTGLLLANPFGSPADHFLAMQLLLLAICNGVRVRAE